MSTVMGLEPGTLIGRDFKVERLLASGNMGSVYIVDQLSTGKKRAMKVMSVELANNERARARFVLEARVASRIDSDHVVEVVSAGIDEATGVPYLVMELLKGEELADMIRRDGPLMLRDTAEILKQAGHALEMAHAEGIVHRDIKPGNLFIAESRREGVPFTVKILDFGIAKLLEERTHDGTQPVGTPLFMSPEQTDRRGRIGPHTDVWPLGLLAFYMLTGTHYWQGGSKGVTALLREVVMDPLVPASQRAAEYGMRESIPVGFDGWFACCVNRNPDERFPEAGAAARAFTQLVLSDAPAGKLTAEFGTASMSQLLAMPPVADAGSGTDMAAAATVGAPEPKSKAPLVVAVVVLLGLATGGYFMIEGDTPETTAEATATATATAAAAPKKVAPCPDGMLLIKGGNMFMGSKDDDLQDDVRPPHKVTVSDFCLDKFEVTVAQYEKCSSKGNCLRAPETVDYSGATNQQKKHFSTLCNASKKGRGKHPINCIDWSMSSNFCKTSGGRMTDGGARLPTEAQWEYAARGSGQRIFPWGDEVPGPQLLNACGTECSGWLKSVKLKSYGMMFDGDDGFPATAPVGTFPKGASSAGVLDLAGNVWEWVADWYGEYSEEAQVDPKGPATGDKRVVRGGGFNGLKPAWAKPAYRWKTAAKSFSHGIGFRCAAGPQK